MGKENRMPRFLAMPVPALLAGLLLTGCAGGPGPGTDLTGTRGDRAAQGREDGQAPEGLLKPAKARPGMLYIRRRNADYTLELLLDTSSVNTAYDIELPDRSAEQ